MQSVDEPAESADEFASAPQRPPTSADVARLAGVSRATVSFVLNAVPDSRVTAETRERVLAAAATLGYVPHAAASALAAGRSQLVLIPFLGLPYSQAQSIYYDRLADRLANHGYTVLFHKDGADTTTATVRQWAALRPVAVVIESRLLDAAALALLERAGVQTILSATLLAGNAKTLAALEETGRTAGEYLLARGHRALAAVVPRDPLLQPIGLARLRGMRRAAADYGAHVARIDLALELAAMLPLVQEWLQSPHPTGVFTYNDEYAALLMRALLDCGLAIPGDVALVGCDNLPLGTALNPQLTSIWPAPDVAGEALADYIHQRIQGHADAATLPVRSTLVIRESA